MQNFMKQDHFRGINNLEEINVLILQCHPGESFWIGKDIQVIVLGYFNGITHIGIEAPHEIKIVRDEIKDKAPDHNHD